MIFVDASAIVAILCNEPERPDLLKRLQNSEDAAVSALVIYEAATGVARKLTRDVEVAEAYVWRFVRESGASVVPIDAEIARLAVSAFATFGKGRHAAGLNMGDCFAYACARARGAALLFKGADFSLTDITRA